MKEGKLFFYQVEAHVGNGWEPVPGQAYACPVGSFRQLLSLLSLTEGQRIRRVGDSFNFPEGDWRPAFLYVGKRGIKPAGLKEWPQ